LHPVAVLPSNLKLSEFGVILYSQVFVSASVALVRIVKQSKHEPSVKLLNGADMPVLIKIHN
jgi:hypothetical protein